MIIRRISIMLFAANAAAAFLAEAGSGRVWGIEQETGINYLAEDVEAAAQSIGSGPLGLIDALGGVAVAAISLVTDLTEIIFAAPILLNSLGTPSWIVTFVFAPLYIVVAFDIIAIMRGDSGI